MAPSASQAHGCNVTATTLALQPGIAEGLVESQDIVADLVVGYSGAGKNLKRTNLLAAEALQSALPYSVGGKHRHIPEILQNFAHAAGKSAAEASEFTLGFTPILRPHVPRYPRHRVRPHDGQGQDTER